MGTDESTTTVTASPDALFAYLSDLHNLPEYFAAMKSADPAGRAEGDVPPGSEAVHTVAEVDGQQREGEAWLTRDADARSLRWGSEGPSDYHGELQVDGEGSDSRVTVRLHTAHVEDARVQDGLDTTLAKIKEEVEARAGEPVLTVGRRRQVRGSRRIGCSGGTSTTAMRRPSGSATHISSSPHGSRRGPRTTVAPRARSSRCAAARSRTCIQSRRRSSAAPGSPRPDTSR